MGRYLNGLFPTVRTIVKPSLFRKVPGKDPRRLARLLASARVKNPNSPDQALEPMYGEVEYEARVLEGEARVGGVVYDGGKLANALIGLAVPARSLDAAAIAFTDRLVSTYSQDDMRHHLRMILCGFPSIVSVPGVVEAPARPREYYIVRQRMEAEGLGDLQMAELKSAFGGRFIDHGDPRIVEVLKGLALQAVLFHLTLEPFCAKRNCRLFNAHWQEELIGSQIGSARLCRHHANLIRSLGARPTISW